MQREATELLNSIEAAREAAERRAGAYWFPLVVAGVLMIVSTWFFDVWDGAGIALFWLGVAPFAYLAIKRYERAQLRLSGAVASTPRSAVAAACFIAGCVVGGAASGATGEPDLVNFGPPLAIAALLATLAWRERSRRWAGWAAATVVFTVVMILRGTGEFSKYAAIGIGANLIVAGFTERNQRGA